MQKMMWKRCQRVCSVSQTARAVMWSRPFASKKTAAAKAALTRLEEYDSYLPDDSDFVADLSEFERAAETEGSHAFGGFIGPHGLIRDVHTTCPFLFDNSLPDWHWQPPSAAAPQGLITSSSSASPSTSALRPRLSDREISGGPMGWLTVLRSATSLLQAAERPTPAEFTDYFGLCLASHFGTVASFVPTNVDAKIRYALWTDQTDPDEKARMVAVALQLQDWDLRSVSTRHITVDTGGQDEVVSGHHGEALSVWCGAARVLSRDASRGTPNADKWISELETAIDEELKREARAFDAAVAIARAGGSGAAMLQLAATLTHNVGDVGQGLGVKAETPGVKPSVCPEQLWQRFGDLARSGFDRYGGSFGRAAAIYRTCLATEGHRNYPLRKPKCLRTNPALFLPLGPFLDDWGVKLATWEGDNWGGAEKAEVVTALIEGCQKVPGQESYFRALAGFDSALSGGLASLDRWLASAPRKGLKDKHLRVKVSTPRASFESSITKRALKSM